MDKALKYYTLTIVSKSKKIIKTDENGIVYEMQPKEYAKEVEEKFKKISESLKQTPNTPTSPF